MILFNSLIYNLRKEEKINEEIIIKEGVSGKFKKTKFYCKVCNNHITESDFKIEVNSSFSHTFFNPYGIVYNIFCFSNALGIKTIGNSSEEFSWFPSYKWEIAICSVCGCHLGWKFTGESVFWGLASDRLVEK